MSSALPSPTTPPGRAAAFATLAVAALALAPTAAAQTLVVPPADAPAASTALPGPVAPFGSDAGKPRRIQSAATLTSALRSDLPLWQRGPVAFRPHLRYRFLHADGIEAGPGNPHDTDIQSFTPGLRFELGPHWTADYTPTWTAYSHAAFRDTFDQVASVAGKIPFRDWVFALNQSYETSHAMLVETGRQTKQERVSSHAGAVRNLGRRTQLELGVSRSVRYANAVTDAPEWTTSDWLQYAATSWLRYQFSPRLDAAVGVSLGYADVSVGDDMTFVQPQAQLTWRPTEKISLGVQAGRETRTFGDRNDARLSSPVYSASVGYQPHPTTKLHASASRSISASYFANEITKGEGWTAGLQQRLLQRLFLDLTYGHGGTSYLVTRALGTVRRKDTYRSINVRLGTILFQRTSFSLLYQNGRNTSDETAYSFVTHQFGGELSHRF